jgi:uncharacterized protein (DUF2147 family)
MNNFPNSGRGIGAARNALAVLAAAVALAGLPFVSRQAAAQQAQASVPPARPAPAAIAGVWIDDTGDGAVEIAPCGNQFCGRIVWLKSPNDAAGRPLTDGYNPDARKKSNPICGLQVIGNLKQVGTSAWDAGWIYDPKEGKSYDVEITPQGPNKIKVTGYLGVKFLSESFIWTRAPANLQPCTEARAL